MVKNKGYDTCIQGHLAAHRTVWLAAAHRLVVFVYAHKIKPTAYGIELAGIHYSALLRMYAAGAVALEIFWYTVLETGLINTQWH